MARAILYRRTSTTDQDLGLSAQEERLQAEADHRGWDAELVTDEGVSGKVPPDEREHLGPALDSLGRGDVLVVSKLDRISRSVLGFADLLRRAEREGWSIVVLDLGIDMTTHNGRLVAHLLMAIAEWEREMISTRITEGLAQSDKRLGRKPGLPPVGGGEPAKVRDEVLAVVRDLHGDGKSPAMIAERLNAYNMESPRGKRWHRTSVKRLLARLEEAA